MKEEAIKDSSFHLFTLTPEQELASRRFLFDKLKPGYVIGVNSVYYLIMELPHSNSNDEVEVLLFNEFAREDILDFIKYTKSHYFEKYRAKITFNDVEGIQIIIPRIEPPPHALFL